MGVAAEREHELTGNLIVFSEADLIVTGILRNGVGGAVQR